MRRLWMSVALSVLALGCSGLPTEGAPCEGPLAICEAPPTGPNIYVCVDGTWLLRDCNTSCGATAEEPDREWSGRCEWSDDRQYEVCWCRTRTGDG